MSHDTECRRLGKKTTRRHPTCGAKSAGSSTTRPIASSTKSHPRLDDSYTAAWHDISSTTTTTYPLWWSNENVRRSKAARDDIHALIGWDNSYAAAPSPFNSPFNDQTRQHDNAPTSYNTLIRQYGHASSQPLHTSTDIDNNHQHALSQPPHPTNPTISSPTPSNQHASSQSLQTMEHALSQSLHTSTIADTLRNNDGRYDNIPRLR